MLGHPTTKARIELVLAEPPRAPNAPVWSKPPCVHLAVDRLPGNAEVGRSLGDVQPPGHGWPSVPGILRREALNRPWEPRFGDVSTGIRDQAGLGRGASELR